MIDHSSTIGKWEKRWHPLRSEWVVYAGHRNSRPWSFDKQDTEGNASPSYDPKCYLCPGNARIHGTSNPDYKDVYIFDNDHPVVGLDSPPIAAERVNYGGVYKTAKAHGIARVVCYDPRHNVTLADVKAESVAKVLQAWKLQMIDFQKMDGINYVLIFENKGEAVGVSNPHPHCQIYATDFTFELIEREMRSAAEFKKETGKNLFEQVIINELEDGRRIIAETDNAVAFIPYFARYAYEVMVMPKRRHATLATLNDEEIFDLAKVFQTVQRRFDTAFQMSFPYVMSIHQAPVDTGNYSDYHLHLSILPPFRQPGLIKYLAGPEIGGGNFMADTIPEEKVKELLNADISNFKEVS